MEFKKGEEIKRCCDLHNVRLKFDQKFGNKYRFQCPKCGQRYWFFNFELDPVSLGHLNVQDDTSPSQRIRG